MSPKKTNQALITGSTGGIGREIANILASRGHNFILLNRSSKKTEVQRAKLQAAYPGIQVNTVIADLMDSAQIAAAIKTINAMPGRVDALYNNSGVLAESKILSANGFESSFAVNTLAPYQLTIGLKEKMARPPSEASAMVVFFSSGAVSGPKTLDLVKLANPDTVTGLMGTYAQSKLAVTALAPALSGILKQHNILVRAVDPGPTKTSMTSGNTAMPVFLRWLAPLLFSPADKQAAKLVASADPMTLGGRTGIFVANRKVKSLPKLAADKTIQQQLLHVLDEAVG